jgi:hypothetical protein
LDGLRELFSVYPFPRGKTVVWLVDELVQVIQHTGSVRIEAVWAESGELAGVVCRSADDPTGEYCLPFTRIGVFRTMLARFAVMCSDETRTEFQPYGGHYSIIRASFDGPVRLDIDFTNTPASQQITITRVPLPRNGIPHSANGSAG